MMPKVHTLKPTGRQMWHSEGQVFCSCMMQSLFPGTLSIIFAHIAIWLPRPSYIRDSKFGGPGRGPAADSLAPRRGTESLKKEIQEKTLKHPVDLEIELRGKNVYILSSGTDHTI